MIYKADFLLSYRNNLKRPLILNGAIGSLLVKYNLNDEVWSSSVNITNPEKVYEIYLQYINAGAEILTTNTFRSNPYFTERIGQFSSKTLVKSGFDILKKLSGNYNFFIAASNPPAEDCYKKERSLDSEELFNNHLHHINVLWENNPSFILNETFSHFDEIKIVCSICSQNNIPFIFSLYSTNGCTILSGESLTEVVDYIRSFGPLAVSFNCISMESFLELNKKIDLSFNHGFYLNVFDFENKIKSENNSNSAYELYPQSIDTFITEKTVFIGSCCGSDYNYTRLLREYYDKKNYN